MTQLLRESKHGPEEMQMLDVITDCGNSLLELINDVLELSKIEAGSLELEYRPVVVRDLLNSIVNMFMVAAADKKLSLTVITDVDHSLRIRTDSAKLKRVLINLVGNAIKVNQLSKNRSKIF
jgi:signal transduction histidine kinase